MKSSSKDVLPGGRHCHLSSRLFGFLQSFFGKQKKGAKKEEGDRATGKSGGVSSKYQAT